MKGIALSGLVSPSSIDFPEAGTQFRFDSGEAYGDQIEHTGVIAGMSGSPVYRNGELIGAVGYRMGSFPVSRSQASPDRCHAGRS